MRSQTNANKPIGPWTPDAQCCFYPLKADEYAPSPVPDQPTCPADRYLRASLAQNERLRLSMLAWPLRAISSTRLSSSRGCRRSASRPGIYGMGICR